MYTIIKAQVNDQNLLITSLPKLASGGHNAVRVDFTFDELWAGLIKTAVFYNDKRAVYHVFVENDTAVVPHEVLANDGTMNLSVFGCNDVQTRTADVVQLTIAEGAITDSTAAPSDPTPDVYQQLLALASETRAIAQSVREDADAGRLDGAPGEDGDPGYTPVRGKDYWTEADKAEIHGYVDAAILNGAW